MAERGTRALSRRPRWMLPLVRRVRSAYAEPPLDRPRELARFIALTLPTLLRQWHDRSAPRVRRVAVVEQRMAERRPWPVPEIHTPGELAELLELDAGQLAWLADVRGLERRVEAPRLRNYHYATLPRSSGLPRVIERPKRRLGEIQRWIHREVLLWIPPHDAAHGFVRGRSAVSNARVHVGAELVVRFDLEDFFASVTAARLFGIFRTAGYAEGVAHALTGLCTNVVPLAEWSRVPHPEGTRLEQAHARLGRRLAAPHLPQGAPTSPALANLAAFGLDRRLDGLARSLGARYTRYADDLAFSGDGLLHAATPTLRRAVAQIVRDEGFAIRAEKSTVVTRAGRQRVCGVVVNDQPNVPRSEYDRLKAILHYAATNGPAAANRLGHPDFRAHLLGRIGWVAAVNPVRGARLRERFDAIDWVDGRGELRHSGRGR